MVDALLSELRVYPIKKTGLKPLVIESCATLTLFKETITLEVFQHLQGSFFFFFAVGMCASL